VFQAGKLPVRTVLTPERTEGFTITETLIALVVLTFGLLAAGPLMFSSIASTMLARSKTAAVVAAQAKLEDLESRYGQVPELEELKPGEHGPIQTKVVDPKNNTEINRFELTWEVATIPDPRDGKILAGRLITVRATPITSDGRRNFKAHQNKSTSVTGIISPGFFR
jgi:Tfp pilus assembly protein PilV